MSNIRKMNLPVVGMFCAACAVNVESMIKSQEGVIKAAVNYANQSVLVEFDQDKVNLEELKNVVNTIGYDIVIDEENSDEIFEHIIGERFRILKIKLIVAIIFSIPVFVISMFFHKYAMEHSWLILLLTLPVVFWSGSQFYIHAYKQIRHLKTSMDTLIALSTGAAFLFSVFNTFYRKYLDKRGMEPHIYYESAVIIITLVLLGKFLEERSRTRSSYAIRKLIGLKPKKITVIREGQSFEIPTEEVMRDDILPVKPGEKIAVDGVVIDGETYLDESTLTGEALPVFRKKGDAVFAGTVNLDGSIQIKTVKVGKDTVLSQIVELIREAQASKPPIQKLADKISSVFVPVVLVIAIITFFVWYFSGTDEPFTMAFLTSITVMIIACPCALGLATPTALVVGIGKAAEYGILIKNAQALELAAKIDTVVLDKTGTLTTGKPEVNEIQWTKDEYNTIENCDILYEIELRSGHPLATAITAFLKESYASSRVTISDYLNISGFGIRVALNGKYFYVGSKRLLELYKIPLPENYSVLTGDKKEVTFVFFSDEKQVLAVIGLSDKMKETSVASVNRLIKNNIEVHLLSGDRYETTSVIAAKAGIDHFSAEVSPIDKINYIKQLQAKGKNVAMAGDGINDAGALAQANLGIAMASGSDIAIESAEITLLRSDVGNISGMILLSHRILKTIRQNFFWAFFYNVISIPVAAGVLYSFTGFLLNPMIAGAAMAFSSVSVVTNSLRLKKFKID